MTENASEGLLSVDTEVVDQDVVIVHLAGEIDISSAHLLSDQLAALASESRSEIILDATGVSFMDSTGLHALVEGKRILHDKGSRIYLVPSRQVRRVLELVFPDPIVAARLDTVEEALAAAMEGARTVES